jgi:hypothetical protein
MACACMHCLIDVHVVPSIGDHISCGAGGAMRASRTSSTRVCLSSSGMSCIISALDIACGACTNGRGAPPLPLPRARSFEVFADRRASLR